MGLKGDIPTERLHPRASYQTPRPRVEKPPSQEVKLQQGDQPCQQPVYVCEVSSSLELSIGFGAPLALSFMVHGKTISAKKRPKTKKKTIGNPGMHLVLW